LLLTFGLSAATASAQTTGDEVAQLRQMIMEMRDDYERRISELEARLDTAEREARVAKRDAGEAFELAE
jgi:predicted component of type VI protein secretion system